MILAEIMGTKKELLTQGKMSQKLIEKYKEASQEFNKLLAKQGTDKSNVIKNVFAIVDQVNQDWASDNPIDCYRGCGWCCYQLVCCTTLEMDFIVKYLQSKPRKSFRKITQKLKKQALQLDKEMKVAFPDGLPDKWEQTAFFLKNWYHENLVRI